MYDRDFFYLKLISLVVQVGEISGTIWESRILSILRNVESVECKHNVLLEMMRRTAIPWSDDLDLCMKEVRPFVFITLLISGFPPKENQVQRRN